MSDNPSAFPTHDSTEYCDPRERILQGGMTLRDYFASHSDQPGVSEIVSMAGHKTDGYLVEFADSPEKLKFNDWWNGLPLDERCLLAARVRYAQADAMLAARTGDA